MAINTDREIRSKNIPITLLVGLTLGLIQIAVKRAIATLDATSITILIVEFNKSLNCSSAPHGIQKIRINNRAIITRTKACSDSGSAVFLSEALTAFSFLHSKFIQALNPFNGLLIAFYSLLLAVCATVSYRDIRYVLQ